MAALKTWTATAVPWSMPPAWTRLSNCLEPGMKCRTPRWVSDGPLKHTVQPYLNYSDLNAGSGSKAFPPLTAMCLPPARVLLERPALQRH